MIYLNNFRELHTITYFFVNSSFIRLNCSQVSITSTIIAKPCFGSNFKLIFNIQILLRFSNTTKGNICGGRQCKRSSSKQWQRHKALPGRWWWPITSVKISKSCRSSGYTHNRESHTRFSLSLKKTMAHV